MYSRGEATPPAPRPHTRDDDVHARAGLAASAAQPPICAACLDGARVRGRAPLGPGPVGRINSQRARREGRGAAATAVPRMRTIAWSLAALCACAFSRRARLRYAHAHHVHTQPLAVRIRPLTESTAIPVRAWRVVIFVPRNTSSIGGADSAPPSKHE